MALVALAVVVISESKLAVEDSIDKVFLESVFPLSFEACKDV